MKLTIQQVQSRVPVTVLGIQGDVDGSTYMALIEKAQELCRAGTHDLLIDLTGVPYLSSAGLVALHNIALLLRGDQPPDPMQGWAALRAIAMEARGPQSHVKLLKPQPRVDKTLEMSGMKQFFEMHDDWDTAIASFS